jgi:GrpB-like predicted nucleotidyltransferase (UPF0157 family)
MCRELMRHLAFRDDPRSHPAEAAACRDLKRELARKYAFERTGYSEARTEYVVAVLRLVAPDLA